MTRQEKMNQVAIEIVNVHEESKTYHSKFMKSGLYADKIRHDALRDELKMLSLQYVMLRLNLESDN